MAKQQKQEETTFYSLAKHLQKELKTSSKPQMVKQSRRTVLTGAVKSQGFSF